MNKLLSKRNITKKPLHSLNYIVLLISHKLRLLHVPVLPSTIDIEPNNWCNFRCDHCQVTHWSKPKNELSTQQFEKIIKQFPKLLLVTVQGMGEPFLNKSTIDMISSLDEKGIASESTSNGSVMPESLLNKFAKLKFFSLYFSMDGGTKKTFEDIRVDGNFDKVTRNIKRLTQRCPTMELGLWSVISNKNMHECEAVVDVAHNVGVRNVFFQTFMTNWGKGDMEENINNKIVNPQRAKKYIDQAIINGKNKQINTMSYSADYLDVGTACIWPWTSMYIDATGYVVPCCAIADSSTLNFGNVFEKDIKEIWNSTEYKSFRKKLKDGDIPKVCEGCYRSNISKDSPTLNDPVVEHIMVQKK